MRAARITAGVGVVLFSGVVVYLIALTFGLVTGVDPIVWLLFIASILLITNSCSYAGGWWGRVGAEQAALRASRMRHPSSVASVPPAAGRQDASLPVLRLADAETQLIPRVVDQLCMSGDQAAEILRMGGLACMSCSHAAPRTGVPGWEEGTWGLCPCCREKWAAGR